MSDSFNGVIYDDINDVFKRQTNLIENISDIVLTANKTQALSLGLKFATGSGKPDIANIVSRNLNYNDTDFDKGFIQGIIAATLSHDNEAVTPADL